MAQKKSLPMTIQDESCIIIERTAIHSSGQLGSFYDAYRDGILEPLSLKNEDKQSKLIKKEQCVIRKGDFNQNDNVLELINMSGELQLSVLTGLTAKYGIVSIIDYPYQVNMHTRFLYYSYVYENEKISEKITKIQKLSKTSTPSTAATHIITGITYGIDVVVVLQLPYENHVANKIDCILADICRLLNNDQAVSVLDSDTENLLRQINYTIVYSNIPALMDIFNVYDVCRYIEKNKNKVIDYPIKYTLQPIKWIFPEYQGPGIVFTSTSEVIQGKIEKHLLECFDLIRTMKHSLDVKISELLHGNLDKRLRDAQHQLLLLTQTHESIVTRFGKLIFDLRKNREKEFVIDKLIYDSELKSSKDFIKLKETMEHLNVKGNFINEIENQHFEYCNAIERQVNKRDNPQTLIRKLTAPNKRHCRILCTNDKLNTKDLSKFNQLRHQLINERQTNKDLNIIYADFSYCAFELKDMTIPTLNEIKHNKQTTKTQSSRSSSSKKTSTPHSPPPSPINDDTINILLLGETGVGKSTFINAFVNYLTFKTFEHAQSNEPVVLIPVSFLITTGENFDEHTVKFGDFDNSNNEDFNHPGQSVTQHCKPFEFYLTERNGKRLCIIDTPGFGDTRGLNQDDINMQNILEYINNLTHLNAVCFLLKPNASELHTVFRMCFTQLIDLLGPNIRDNIIFCFTNARSTFYTPGDTAPLLKTMLKSLTMTDIQFKKENTFCFDNESFRYLVAVQDGVIFDNDEEKNEYKMSWSTSVKESNRLIDYICTQLNVCPMNNTWKSMKRAEIEIVHIIRPILEAIRNILRNIILCRMQSPNESIKLQPKPIYRPATICLSCKPYPLQVGSFWTVREITHEPIKKCLVCSCAPDQHVPINYVLNYKNLSEVTNESENEMIIRIEELCDAGAKFDYFLMNMARCSKQERFWLGLIHMIQEENEICQSQRPNRLNVELVKDLKNLKYEYEKQIEDLKSNQQLITLPIIFKTITAIQSYSIIQEQMIAIKKTQEMMTESYEIIDD